MAVHYAQAILIQSFLLSRFVVVYFQMEAQFSLLLHICISTSLLKSKFQKDY